jgi:hypothetical protein
VDISTCESPDFSMISCIIEIQQVKVIYSIFTREKPLKNQEAGNNFKKMEVVSRRSLGNEQEE